MHPHSQESEPKKTPAPIPDSEPVKISVRGESVALAADPEGRLHRHLDREKAPLTVPALPFRVESGVRIEFRDGAILEIPISGIYMDGKTINAIDAEKLIVKALTEGIRGAAARMLSRHLAPFVAISIGPNRVIL